MPNNDCNDKMTDAIGKKAIPINVLIDILVFVKSKSFVP